MDYTKIIVSIIALLCALAEAFLIPWIRERVSADKLRKLEQYARIGVTAAEQLFATEQWQEKKRYVQMFLDIKGYKIETTEVDAAIEAAVLSLHKQLQEG